jgi:restriction system protein
MSKEMANFLTVEAQAAVDALRRFLPESVATTPTRDWGHLKDHTTFRDSAPALPPHLEIPPEPQPTDSEYSVVPPHSISQSVSVYFRWLPNPVDEASERFAHAKKEWEEKKLQIERARELVTTHYVEHLAAWEDRKRTFYKNQERQNLAVDALLDQFREGDSEYFTEGMELFLMQASHPPCCPREYAISLDTETAMMVIDQRAPALNALPDLKEVKFNKSTGALVEVKYSSAKTQKLYDDFVYQLFFRTARLAFAISPASKLKSVVLNMWVRSVDPSTGHDTTGCIMSAQIDRDVFASFNLSGIDPKACFRALKGIGHPSLHTMTPVAPVMRVNKEDTRFVESREVVDQLREGTNIAAIGWEDFEHLIRELFQKELSQSGAEVKVTRASRDGGVDAIAFDPDPIRGGKIIIQAKRYTNTVDVSSVRDLYGTIMSEGAIKGILVTTSSYGPDAYSFAKNKPITLLDGNNLLHLLGRHGHRAYINLAEAKKLNLNPLARTISTDENANERNDVVSE